MKLVLLLLLLIWELGKVKRGRVGYWLFRGEDKGDERGGGGGVEESEKEFAVWLECEGLEDGGDKRLMRLCCGK